MKNIHSSSHDGFAAHFKDVLNGAALNQKLITNYLSRPTTKDKEFYLGNILYECDREQDPRKITQDILDITTQYVSWLLKEFSNSAIKNWLVYNIFHENCQYDLYTFSLDAFGPYYAYNMAECLENFDKKFGPLFIHENLALEFFNETYAHLQNKDDVKRIFDYYTKTTLEEDPVKIKSFMVKIKTSDIHTIYEQETLNSRIENVNTAAKGFKL